MRRLLASSQIRPFLGGVFLSLFAAICLTSCSDDFAPYYDIRASRIIVLQADKPMLSEGESTDITAVDYTSGSATYNWSWCPLRITNSTKGECPIKRQDLIDAIKAKYGDSVPAEKYIPSFDLPSGRTTTFTYPGPKIAIKGLCEALVKAAEGINSPIAGALPTLDCERSYEVSIRLEATYSDKTIVSYRRITLNIDEADINHNPSILKMQIRPADFHEAQILRVNGADWIKKGVLHDQMWTDIDPSVTTANPLNLVENGEFEIRVLVDENSLEEWQPPKKSGTDQLPPREKESLSYAWFFTQEVKLEMLQSGFHRDGKTSLEEIGNAKFTAKCARDKSLRAPNCEPFEVWSVVRDSRLGTTFQTRAFRSVGFVEPREQEDDDD